MTKLKNSKVNKTKKLKMCHNLETPIVTNLKFWQNSLIQIATNQNIFFFLNFKLDQTQKLKCEKTKYVTKLLTQNAICLKNTKCDKTQNIELWQNWKTQNVITKKNLDAEIVTKLKNLSSHNTKN